VCCLVNPDICYFADEEPLQKWRHMLDLNLVALSLLTRACVRDMRTRGVDDGHIVHIGRHVLHDCEYFVS
jgi:short-subunit dehydrogenase